MLNSLFDCWKSLTTIGTVSLPVIGFFFLGAKSSVNWSNPLGYYTKLKLFIKRNESAQQASVAILGASEAPSDRYRLIQASSSTTTQQSGNQPDLIAEYPITSLDKESWWKYCLPKGSKLQKNGQVQTTSSPVATEEECQLQYRHKGSEVVDYLLRLGLRFLKLQHQINLFLFYHSDKSSSLVKDLTNGSDWKDQLLTKCSLKEKGNGESLLKDFFVSTSPVSKDCLLVPSQVEITLTLREGTEQVKAESSSSTEVKLDEVKKGTISGNVSYSFSDYYGKLKDFSWKDGYPSKESNCQTTNNPVLISLKPAEEKKFEFKLDEASGSSGGSNGQSSLKFKELWDKYEKRDLKLCDFWKSTQDNGGGGTQLCKPNSK